MAKNVDVTKYRNGDPIPKVTDNEVWAKLTTGAYCYYNNDSVKYAATYGKMYNFYAVADPRGLAPAGWHVASDEEWAALVSMIGGNNNAGCVLKEKGTSHWYPSGNQGSDIVGFKALPGGTRNGDGSFGGFMSNVSFWSSSNANEMSAVNYYLYSEHCRADMQYFIKCGGAAVRCIKN